MTRPSGRHVLPEFTERTTSGRRTLDPYAKLLEERIVFLGTPVDDTSANDAMAQFMHLISQDIERDTVLDARQAVEYGLVDRVVQGRKGVPGAPAGR